jgi:hypothetical protein
VPEELKRLLGGEAPVMPQAAQAAPAGNGSATPPPAPAAAVSSAPPSYAQGA